MSQPPEQPHPAEWEIPTQRLPRLQMPPQQMPAQPLLSQQVPPEQMSSQQMPSQPGGPVPVQNQARVKRFGWLALSLTAGVALALGAALGATGDRATTAEPAATVTATATATATVTEDASESPSTSPTKTTPPKPKETSKPKTRAAVKVTMRQWAKVVKNPDAYKGKRYIIYGQVTQFDSATGTDTFRADTAHTDTTETNYGFFDGGNTVLTGDEEHMSGLVEDDVFRASVTVIGAFDYDVSGNTNVPYLRINSLKVVGNNR